MLPKPDPCVSCPLYGDGKGFVPGHYPPKAKVLLYGPNPSDADEKAETPLAGSIGQELARTYAPLAGLDLSEVAKDFTIRCRWKEPGKKTKGTKLPTGVLLDQALAHCSVYDQPLETFDLVVAMGQVSLRKLAPGYKQSEWRGHLIS